MIARNPYATAPRSFMEARTRACPPRTVALKNGTQVCEQPHARVFSLHKRRDRFGNLMPSLCRLCWVCTHYALCMPPYFLCLTKVSPLSPQLLCRHVSNGRLPSRARTFITSITRQWCVSDNQNVTVDCEFASGGCERAIGGPSEEGVWCTARQFHEVSYHQSHTLQRYGPYLQPASAASSFTLSDQCSPSPLYPIDTR